MRGGGAWWGKGEGDMTSRTSSAEGRNLTLHLPPPLVYGSKLRKNLYSRIPTSLPPGPTLACPSREDEQISKQGQLPPREVARPVPGRSRDVSRRVSWRRERLRPGFNVTVIIFSAVSGQKCSLSAHIILLIKFAEYSSQRRLCPPMPQHAMLGHRGGVKPLGDDEFVLLQRGERTLNRAF